MAVIKEDENKEIDAINDMLGDSTGTPDLDPEASADDGDTGADDTTGGDGSGGADDSVTTQSEEEIAAAVALASGDAGGEGGEAEGDTATDDKDAGLVIEDLEALRQSIASMGTPAIEVPKVEVDADGKEIEFNPLDLFKEDVNYITEENLKDIADNPLLLNAAMNNVRRQTAENLLQIVPALINKAIQENTVKQEVHTNFYTKHKELVPYKAYVSVVAKKVAAKMPDKSKEEILDAVAQSVKASLKLETKAAKDTKAEGKKVGGKPALRASKGGGRANSTSAVAKSSMLTEIDAMLS